MRKKCKTYSYFEFKAATFYFEDIKLHLQIDQADSGFCLEKGEWEIGLKNPAENLNFHQLWDHLNENDKETYRKLAYHDLYSEQEKDLYIPKSYQ